MKLNRRTVEMTEGEVNYASVIFPPKAKKEEETVSKEEKVQSKTTEKTADTHTKNEEQTVYDNVKSETTKQTADVNLSAGFWADQKTNSRGRCYQQVACCLGILCVILLSGIIAVCVYKNQNLTSRNQDLQKQNQELETERKNLTEQIRIMETKWNELNVSRAQWSIDAYCPKPENQNRQCKACQDGWLPSQSSCYAINNPPAVSGQKTWEEAQENCTGKISNLVVIADQTEKDYVYTNSWNGLGYWIGLRVEAGNWTWVDGTILKTQDYWTESPSAEARCAISIRGTPSKGWKAVKCDEKYRWICEKKALSV